MLKSQTFERPLTGIQANPGAIYGTLEPTPRPEVGDEPEPSADESVDRNSAGDGEADPNGPMPDG